MKGTVNIKERQNLNAAIRSHPYMAIPIPEKKDDARFLESILERYRARIGEEPQEILEFDGMVYLGPVQVEEQWKSLNG